MTFGRTIRKTVCLPLICVLGFLFPLTAVSADQVSSRPLVAIYDSKQSSLDEILAGASGEATILYYLPDAGVQQPALVVRLSRDEGAGDSTALVFDTPADETYVPVDFVDGYPTLPHRLAPTITMVADGGWWLRDGLVNYNLDIQINGPVMAMWSPGGIRGWSSSLADGQPNAHIVVRDPDGDGMPDWDWRTMLPELPEWGGYRTAYAERKCSSSQRSEPGPLGKWPFVAGDSGLGYEQTSGVLRPPIVVDWAAGRVRFFSEIVSLRYQSCSYGMYSIERVLPAQMNSPNFEVPFAFYDLSGRGEGLPNLIVRTGRTILEQDAMGLASEQMEVIRYSWSNEDVGDLSMDYKVDLFGFHPYDFETPIAGGQALIDAPSYESFPAWVVSKDWPAVTFVDTEERNYLTSEGIYEWDTGRLGSAFYLGFTDSAYIEAFEDIGAGLRGEYRVTREMPLGLYLSPVDNRLHLKWAERGVWRLDEEEVVRVDNPDGDEFIDVWSREVAPVATEEPVAGKEGGAGESLLDDKAAEPEVIEAIFALGSHLLYGGQGRVAWVEADYKPSLFETLPPIDHDTWQVQRSQLAPYEAQRRDPQDLRAWLDAFPGPRGEIVGANLAQARATGDGGFRFELSLDPGYQVDGTAGPDLSSLAPGDYLVAYHDTFSVQPLTPALVDLVPGSLVLEPAAAVALQPMHVGLQLHNTGLEDLPELAVQVYAGLEGSDPLLVAEEVVGILAGETVPLVIPWTPPRAGDWRLDFTWDEDPEATIGAGESRAAVDLHVRAQPPLAAGQILQLSNVGHPLPLLALLGALGLSAAALGILLVRPAGGRR